MFKRILLILIVLCIGFHAQAASSKCELHYKPMSRLSLNTYDNADLSQMSQAANTVLKTTYETLNKLDHASYGLVSAILLSQSNTGLSLEDIKPDQWDQVVVSGALVFRESRHIEAPLRGAKLTFSNGKKSRTITTGTRGEFTQFFHKLVPYERLRLFPVPIYEKRDQNKIVLNVPIDVKLNSKICKASVTIHKVPLEPLLFYVTNSN